MQSTRRDHKKPQLRMNQRQHDYRAGHSPVTPAAPAPGFKGHEWFAQPSVRAPAVALSCTDAHCSSRLMALLVRWRTTAHEASVKAAVDVGARDALQRQHKGGGAQRHALLAVDVPQRRKGLGHAAVQALVHLRLLPPEVLQVLHPLEEAHRHAACARAAPQALLFAAFVASWLAAKGLMLNLFAHLSMWCRQEWCSAVTPDSSLFVALPDST